MPDTGAPTSARQTNIVVVMGQTGSGKSTFTNLASNVNFEVGNSLESCTHEVQVAKPFILDGRMVTLVDTPGFDDTQKSEAAILKTIADFLASTYAQGTKVAGVIYLQRISDYRMGGIATQNFRLFRKICGEAGMENVIIVTNMWGMSGLGRAIEENRERELGSNDLFFKPALDKGATMLRHHNTIDSAQAILRAILRKKPQALRIQREMVDERKPLVQTEAGTDLKDRLEDLRKQQQEELRQLREEMTQAMAQLKAAHQQELSDVRQQHQEEITKIKNDLGAASVATETELRESIQELDQTCAELRGKLERIEQDAAILHAGSADGRKDIDEKLGMVTDALQSQKAKLAELHGHALAHEESKKETTAALLRIQNEQRELEMRQADAAEHEKQRQIELQQEKEVRRRREIEERAERAREEQRRTALEEELRRERESLDAMRRRQEEEEQTRRKRQEQAEALAKELTRNMRAANERAQTSRCLIC